MKILTVPEDTKILRSKSQPIKKIDAGLIEFLKDLGRTLKSQTDPAGVGLSAIQVGQPLRVFAMLLPEQGKKEEGRRKKEKPILTFYINPEIVEHSAEMTLGEDLVEQKKKSSGLRPSSFVLRPFLEGCLSIPRVYGTVERWQWTKVKAIVLNQGSESAFVLRPSSFVLEKLASRVFQHELDHLNGILFTDHTLAEGGILYRETGDKLVEMEM